MGGTTNHSKVVAGSDFATAEASVFQRIKDINTSDHNHKSNVIFNAIETAINRSKAAEMKNIGKSKPPFRFPKDKLPNLEHDDSNKDIKTLAGPSSKGFKVQHIMFFDGSEYNSVQNAATSTISIVSSDYNEASGTSTKMHKHGRFSSLDPDP